jgi:predicted transcriptional regulator of viral defense system
MPARSCCWIAPIGSLFPKLLTQRSVEETAGDQFSRAPAFRAGVEVVAIDDVSVRIYSAEKTIADCFKYRNKIGLDVAIEALRAYRERTPKPNRAALAKFAQINRVQKIMRPYPEAAL